MRRTSPGAAKTATALAEAFIHRIATGEFREGDLLPSCRGVARELDMDKNTVNKAYRLLEEMGIVRAALGRGVIVVQRGSASLSEERLRHDLDAVIWRARAWGVSEEMLWQHIGDSVRRLYTLTLVSVGFIECNRYETDYFAQQLEEYISQPIGRIILDDFLAAPAHSLEAYDILVTTGSHLAAVLLAAGSKQHKIVGVHSMPVMNDVRRLAEIQKGSKTAVVCTAEPTISILYNLVRSYNPHMHIYPCLASDTASLAAAIAQADLIIDTATSHGCVLALTPQVPIITVPFTLDHQSLSAVKDKVMELIRARLGTAPQTPVHSAAGKGRHHE